MSCKGSLDTSSADAGRAARPRHRHRHRRRQLIQAPITAGVSTAVSTRNLAIAKKPVISVSLILVSSATTLHLDKQQPGGTRQASTDPVRAKQFNNGHCACPDAKASNEESGQSGRPLNLPYQMALQTVGLNAGMRAARIISSERSIRRPQQCSNRDDLLIKILKTSKIDNSATRYHVPLG